MTVVLDTSVFSALMPKADLENRGTRLEDIDVAMAAHALAIGGAVATGNIRHMSRIRGVPIEDWTTRA